MSERCAICHKKCSPTLYRQRPNGKKEALCKPCADKWLESNEEWGNEPQPKPYFGPFPQVKRRMGKLSP